MRLGFLYLRLGIVARIWSNQDRTFHLVELFESTSRQKLGGKTNWFERPYSQ